MDPKQDHYQVVITEQAEDAYYRLLGELFDRYSPERFGQIGRELYAKPDELNTMPHRGTLESRLAYLGKDHRYILYHRTNAATVKVVYYVYEPTKKVYITDFYPTESDPQKLRG